jgi:hypothetical protein
MSLFPRSAHTFHIPVMGTGFTIDTPLRVAKYGISSVISLVDDVLVEQLRRFHCEREGESYEEIGDCNEDARARRITAYLNLVDRLVRRQVADLQSSPFEPGSEITRYYQMLPPSPLKGDYREMLATPDPATKALMQEGLRSRAVPGNIEVNIMTKLDRDVYHKGKALPPEFADDMAALRGFAESDLAGAVVFSAGMNQRLYSYAASFDDFFPREGEESRKWIVLKVSDYRSAMIQGRFLAKRGLWVSEYRVESGLNCGGHAFTSAGQLLGPILAEFLEKKPALLEKLHGTYAKALAATGRPVPAGPRAVRITAQGGIGTPGEDQFLLKHFKVDGTGWATPFMLVPEAVNLDPALLDKLVAAGKEDVYLSDGSPLKVPYWNLRTSAAEEARMERIREGRPGSTCLKRHAAINGEFSKIPICISARGYVKRKLEHLPEEGLTEEQLAVVTTQVLARSCICHDLAGSATLKHGIDPEATPAACPGPAIAFFSKIAALEEMVGYVYGQCKLPVSLERPHMFIRELQLNVQYLREEIERFSLGLLPRAASYFAEFKTNLLSGIEYYRKLSECFVTEERERFLTELKALGRALEQLPLVAAAEPADPAGAAGTAAAAIVDPAHPVSRSAPATAGKFHELHVTGTGC